MADRRMPKKILCRLAQRLEGRQITSPVNSEELFSNLGNLDLKTDRKTNRQKDRQKTGRQAGRRGGRQAGGQGAGRHGQARRRAMR